MANSGPNMELRLSVENRVACDRGFNSHRPARVRGIRKKTANRIYKAFRCGLLHNSGVRAEAFLNGQQNLLEWHVVSGQRRIVIDPHRFAQACSVHAREVRRRALTDRTVRGRLARIFHLYVGIKHEFTLVRT